MNTPINIQYDLHSHSTASDGTLEPAVLVERAAVAGVNVLALTDHDTTAGISRAQEAAAAHQLQLVPGVEISVSWQKQVIHILGLHIDPQDRQLLDGLKKLQDFRHWRAEEMGLRLEKKGIPGTYEAAGALAKGGLIARTHFARVLMDQGYGRTMQSIFKHFLVPGKPGYVPGEWAPLDQAIGWIRAAGGQAVIAHPARYRLSASKLRQLVGEFCDCDGMALEVVSGSHSRDDAHHMARVATKFKLLGSQGSDYHGPEKPWVKLGQLKGLPPECTPIWESQWWRTASGVIESSPVSSDALLHT